MFEAETRDFISLATLCLVTDPPCSDADWEKTPESDLFEAMIDDFTEAQAKQLLSYVIGVAIGLIEDATSEHGVNPVDYLRDRALQVARGEF